MDDAARRRLAKLTGILPVLRALNDGETLTGAADSLGISQPALSRAMARWESELGIRITTRDGRRISLTAEGKALAIAASDALGGFERVLNDVFDSQNQQPLRLGALRSVSGEIATMMAETRFSSGLSVSEGSSRDLLDLLDQDRLDAAILGPRPVGDRYQWRFLRWQPFCLVVPPGHRLDRGQPVFLGQAANERFVAMESSYTTRHFADELCEDAGISPAIAVESDNSHTLRSFVAAGVGLCILPKAMTSRDTSVRALPIMCSDGSMAAREIGLVQLADRTPSVQVKKALQLLTERAIAMKTS